MLCMISKSCPAMVGWSDHTGRNLIELCLFVEQSTLWGGSLGLTHSLSVALVMSLLANQVAAPVYAPAVCSIQTVHRYTCSNRWYALFLWRISGLHYNTVFCTDLGPIFKCYYAHGIKLTSSFLCSFADNIPANPFLIDKTSSSSLAGWKTRRISPWRVISNENLIEAKSRYNKLAFSITRIFFFCTHFMINQWSNIFS